MSTQYAAPNTAFRIEHLVLDSLNVPVTGLLTVRTRVRSSAGLYFDWSDNTFKTYASVVTLHQTLTQDDATGDPGWYSVNFPGAAAGSYRATVEYPSGTIVGYLSIEISALPTAAAVAALQTDLTAALARLPAALVAGRMDASVGAMQTDVVTAGAVSAAAVTKIQVGLALGSDVAAVPAAVASTLAAAHGAGSWITASGFAVAGDQMALTAGALAAIDSALAGAHGAGSWTTATGFATPGAAMALTSGERTTVQALILSDGTPFPGARIDASISSRSSQASVDALPTASAINTELSSSHGVGSWATASGYATSSDISTAITAINAHTDARATAVLASIDTVPAAVWAVMEDWGGFPAGSFGYGLALLRMGLTNRLEYTPGAPGALRLYNDNNVLALAWVETDYQGNGVTGQAGAPARRGKAT